MSKNLKLLLIFTVSVLAVYVLWLRKPAVNKTVSNQEITTETATPTEAVASDQFEYKGKDNVDALTLLEDNADVELDNSGLVTSINGRKADSAKREFWGFYVNGEMANVGPASYTTKESDLILWKIETY
jgi:hypothetical protein